MSALTEQGPERSSTYLDLGVGADGAQAEAVDLAVSSWELSTHEPMRNIVEGDGWNRRADAEAFAHIAGGLSAADPEDDEPPPALAQARDALGRGTNLGRGTSVAVFCAAAARFWPRLPPDRRTSLVAACQHTIRGHALCIQGGFSQVGACAAARGLVELDGGLGLRSGLAEHDAVGGWVGGMLATATIIDLSTPEVTALDDVPAAARLAEEVLDWIDAQVAACRETTSLVDVLGSAHRLYLRESLLVHLLESLRRAGVPTASVEVDELAAFAQVAEEHRVEHATLLRGRGRQLFELAHVDPADRGAAVHELVGNLPGLPDAYVRLAEGSGSLDADAFLRDVVATFDDAADLLTVSERLATLGIPMI